MKDIIIFHSAADVLDGERKLINAGINVQSIPAPKAKSPSCGICLLINHSDSGKARMLLGSCIKDIILAGDSIVLY